ncbi:MAG TPA: hypothetical protein VF624_01980 [Tepidisphaeraceae bacterium]
MPEPIETLKAAGFDPAAVKPLGTFFTNDFPHTVVDTREAFRVDPPVNGTRKAYAVTAIVAGFFVVAAALIDQYAPVNRDRTIALVAFGIIGVGTTAGVLALGLARQRYFQRRGPALRFDKATGRLHIPGGRVFERGDVVALLCLSLDHHHQGRSAELNLLARVDGVLKRYLLLTWLHSRVRVWDYIAKPFVAATGVPAYRIWNKGFFGQGEICVEDVAARLSERQPSPSGTSS